MGGRGFSGSGWGPTRWDHRVRGARSHCAYTSAVPDKPINLTEVLVNEARTRGFTTWRACCRRGGWIAATAQELIRELLEE